MSCFNCYSSRKIDSELIDNILVRGQRLRSAMVQSILNHDPLNQDVIFSQQKCVKLDELTRDSDEKIRAFLQGDEMSREDEIHTLETLRSMSAADLCRATDRTYHSEKQCDCLTCVEYHEKDLKCDLKRGENHNEITQKIQEKYKTEVGSFLKFVDSLKVSINSVVLNPTGQKKVSGVKDKTTSVGQTFFLEYQIPEVLTRNHQKRAKVDSGLDSGNIVRLCARGSHLQAISFKQVSVHDCDLSRIRLDEASITFRLSVRNYKQKHPVSLGVAKFNFSSFEVSKNFLCNQELTLRLNEGNPIVVGGLKVSIQLGCGRLYFGKEFLDAVTNNKENSVVLGSDDFSSSTESDLTEKALNFYPEKYNENTYQKHINIPKLKLAPSVIEVEPRKFGSHTRKTGAQNLPQLTQKKVESIRKSEPIHRKAEPIRKSEPIHRKAEPTHKKPEPPSKRTSRSEFSHTAESAHKKTGPPTQKTSRSEFSHTAEPTHKKPEPATQRTSRSEYTRERSSEPPSRDSDLVNKPVLFGFIYISEARFSREVMNSYLRCQMFVSDDFCCSKLVAFDSNPVYNFSQQVPVICENDFLLKLRENFMVVEFYEKGQKDFLLGFSKVPLHQFYLSYRNPVIVKYLSERTLPVVGTDGWEPIHHPSNGQVVGQAQFLVALGTNDQIDNLEKDRGFKTDTVKAKSVPKSVDVGIQSTMESKNEIETFLDEIQKNRVSQTEENPGSGVRSTSDLLDSLQKALSIDNITEKNSFRAHILINSALHLPSRRKCKSKRSKGRNSKHEDILPSTYVTFEDSKGDLKVTPIVPKTTTPKWEYQCDVNLPAEYLTDNQKFLVFKVWRKSTNTTMTPNMQVDHVIGFATVDLTVLSAGLPSLQGWFNINDLSKKCNGQINIHVTPLENVMKYQPEKCCIEDPTTSSQPPEPPFEPGELLGRALKRKFTELDEITQRLRLRLSKVTNDETDTSNDDVADEFERDINTLCVEDDFDTVNFESEARTFNLNHITLQPPQEMGLLQADQHLVESKQKIDQMLEKLSLMSGESSSRYVSGCSDGRIDAEALLNVLDSESRPNLYSSTSFNREMTEKFGGIGTEKEEKHKL